jgi:hypothetical protein
MNSFMNGVTPSPETPLTNAARESEPALQPELLRKMASVSQYF